MGFRWLANKKAVAWGVAEGMQANPSAFDTYPAIHAYICPMDALPILSMWRVPKSSKAVRPSVIISDLKDKGFDQHRIFSAPPTGQGVEYTPVRDSRGKGTIGRHIHDVFKSEEAEKAAKYYYYGNSGDWFPLVYMDPITAINVWIEYLIDRLAFDHKKKITPINHLRPALPEMREELLAVLRDNPEKWGLVEDATGRGPPMLFVNRGQGRRNQRWGGVTLPWMRENLPFLDWRVVPEKETEEDPGYAENPSVKQRVAQMKVALRAWAVPGEVSDGIDLHAYADPSLTAGENVRALVEAFPVLREYARSTARGSREIGHMARQHEEEMTEEAATRVMDVLAARMETGHPGRGEDVREAVEWARPQITSAVARRQRAMKRHAIKNPGVVIAAPHATTPRGHTGHPSDTIVAELAVLTANALRGQGVPTRAILAGTPRTKRDMNRRKGRGSEFRKTVEEQVGGRE